MTGGNIAVDDLVRQLLAKRTPAERLQMCSRMFATAKALVLARWPGESFEQTPVEIRRQLFLRFYGKEFTQKQTEDILQAISRT